MYSPVSIRKVDIAGGEKLLQTMVVRSLLTPIKTNPTHTVP
jgi:hypothetical protein